MTSTAEQLSTAAEPTVSQSGSMGMRSAKGVADIGGDSSMEPLWSSYDTVVSAAGTGDETETAGVSDLTAGEATPAAEVAENAEADEGAAEAAVPLLPDELPATDPYIDVVSEKGQKARGLYFSGPKVAGLGVRNLVATLRLARMDAAVIDLKDEKGRVTFRTSIPDLLPQVEVLIPDVHALTGRLRKAGIYTIARIVCFADRELARRFPERAVKDSRPRNMGQLWSSWGSDGFWLDPYHPENHRVIVELAREAAAMGFDEIQLDYIRFPVNGNAPFAVFPSQSDQPRERILLDLLERIDAAVPIPLGVDVFGLTAFNYRTEQVDILGQNVELWAQHVEVFTPMLYLNGMQSLMSPDEKRRAGRLVSAGISRLRKRLGPEPVIRPFLQAFEQGADYYTPGFIAEQILGARWGGADGFLFWHPGSDYTMVRRGMETRVHIFCPFPIAERMALRKRLWSARAASAWLASRSSACLSPELMAGEQEAP